MGLVPQAYLRFFREHVFGGYYAGSSSQGVASCNRRSSYNGFTSGVFGLLEERAHESS
jgi:hypothetical protein